MKIPIHHQSSLKTCQQDRYVLNLPFKMTPELWNKLPRLARRTAGAEGQFKRRRYHKGSCYSGKITVLFDDLEVVMERAWIKLNATKIKYLSLAMSRYSYQSKKTGMRKECSHCTLTCSQDGQLSAIRPMRQTGGGSRQGYTRGKHLYD